MQEDLRKLMHHGQAAGAAGILPAILDGRLDGRLDDRLNGGPVRVYVALASRKITLADFSKKATPTWRMVL